MHVHKLLNTLIYHENIFKGPGVAGLWSWLKNFWTVNNHSVALLLLKPWVLTEYKLYIRANGVFAPRNN